MLANWSKTPGQRATKPGYPANDVWPTKPGELTNPAN
jgi:hypothetical protein